MITDKKNYTYFSIVSSDYLLYALTCVSNTTSADTLIIHIKNLYSNKRPSIPFPCDSILDAMLTVSPKRQYRGILLPTTPAAQGPINDKTNKYQVICVIDLCRKGFYTT